MSALVETVRARAVGRLISRAALNKYVEGAEANYTQLFPVRIHSVHLSVNSIGFKNKMKKWK